MHDQNNDTHRIAILTLMTAAWLSACADGGRTDLSTGLGGNAERTAAAWNNDASVTAAASNGAEKAPQAVGTWQRIGGEHDTLTVATDSTVRYGADGAYVQKIVSGTFMATNQFFGEDPVYGVLKSVELLIPGNASDASWQRVGGEHDTITVPAGSTVRYGANGVYVQKIVSGTFMATNQFFGEDPVHGVLKSVELLRSATPSAPPSAPDHSSGHGHAPAIDTSKIPTGSRGYSTDRVSYTGEMPSRSEVGAFRTFCEFSHMAFDDPIVHPGQPGKAHLHAFFGNTGVNAHSTAESIATSGNSTCRGGTVNRSGYWVTAMIDTKDGRPLAPSGSHFYYKTGYSGIAPAQVRAFPIGLRIVAGNADNAGPADAMRFKCLHNGRDSMYGPSIPNCPAGSELWSEVFFPQCWDGVNLDSSDHKSHMAYPSGGRCPATHPVAGPEITFNVVYPVTEANAPLRWRLSSDRYDPKLPGGYSLHADWFNGWKADIMDTWIRKCDQASADCHSHLLGDGRAIY